MTERGECGAQGGADGGHGGGGAAGPRGARAAGARLGAAARGAAVWPWPPDAGPHAYSIGRAKARGHERLTCGRTAPRPPRRPRPRVPGQDRRREQVGGLARRAAARMDMSGMPQDPAQMRQLANVLARPCAPLCAARCPCRALARARTAWRCACVARARPCPSLCARTPRACVTACAHARPVCAPDVGGGNSAGANATRRQSERLQRASENGRAAARARHAEAGACMHFLAPAHTGHPHAPNQADRNVRGAAHTRSLTP